MLLTTPYSCRDGGFWDGGKTLGVQSFSSVPKTLRLSVRPPCPRVRVSLQNLDRIYRDRYSLASRPDAPRGSISLLLHIDSENPKTALHRVFVSIAPC